MRGQAPRAFAGASREDRREGKDDRPCPLLGLGVSGSATGAALAQGAPPGSSSWKDISATANR